MFETTCLVFPYTAPYTGIEERLVYPDRKSALEIRLDEWFAQEAIALRQQEWRASGATVIDASAADSMLEGLDLAALGFKPEVIELIAAQRSEGDTAIFRTGAEMSPHASWRDPDIVDAWIAAIDEHFHDVVTNERWVIEAVTGEELDALEEICVQQVQHLLAADPRARRRTIHWELHEEAGRMVPAPDDGDGEYPDPERTTAGDWLALVWDGMRSLPYSDHEVAIALGQVAAALAWIARGETPWLDDSALRLELVMAMGFDPVVIVPDAALRWALRDDLPDLLSDRWAALADDPWRLISAVNDPRILFDFARWQRLFAVYLIPSQVIMNAQGGGSVAVYHPLLPTAIRLH